MKNTLFFVLLCIFSLMPFGTNGDTYGLFITNSNLTIQIGIVDYTLPSQNNPPIMTIPGLLFNGGFLQQSAYNYNTKVLTLIANAPLSTTSYLYVIDCNQWKVLSSLNFPYGNTYRGLASDQSTNQPFNIWGTVQGPNGMLVNKINPLTLQIQTIDTFYATWYASTVGPNSDYYITFSNSTGLYVKCYSMYGQSSFEQKFTFSNFQSLPKGPFMMVYSPLTNTILSSIIINNSDGSSYSALVYLDWQSSQFQLTNMTTHAQYSPNANVPDINNANLFYSIGHIGYQFYIYQYNLYNQQFLSAYPIKTQIMAAY